MDKKNKNPEIRFKGFIDNWKIDFIGFHYDFKNGLNKGKEYFGYGKPIVNFTDVFHKRGLLAKDLKGKVDVTNDEIKNYSVKEGDIFFTRTSETIDEIGRPSVMMGEAINTVFSGFVLRARPISIDPLEISFKQYAFFTDFFRSEMIKKSSMTTRALTSGTAIKKMMFAFPENKTEQKQIGTFFQNLDNLISLHQKKYDKLVILKKAMLVKMFPKKGDLVPEIRFKGFSEDWEKDSLGNIYNFQYGIFNTNPSNGGEFPVYGANGIIGGYTDYNAENSIIIGHMGEYAGIVLWEKRKHFVTYNGIITTPQNEKINIKFGYFMLYKLNLRKICGGSGQPFLSYSTLNNISSIYPKSKVEQQKIGSYFENLDNQLALHKTQLNKLNNIKKACFSKMFVAQE
jgi:type I restriction enzyme S subunit